MADKPFVVNDRRKFTAEGDPRPDAPPSEPKPPRERSPEEFSSASHAQPKGPQAVPDAKSQPASDAAQQDKLPPPPTAEETAQAVRAYESTVDRLDTAIRAQNPGMEPIPPTSFAGLVQSIYMQAIMQLGGAGEPGQKPQVDLLGARQSIDMLTLLAEKTQGNLSDTEDQLMQAALFEARMGFLEVTQHFARQAAARQPGTPPPPAGPSIVR